MRPETRRRLINSILSIIVFAGLLRFASGELTRREKIHEREVERLRVQLTEHRTEVQTLKTQLKELKEKVKIVRKKDKDGNEVEVIERETDSKESSTESQILITELKMKVKELEKEKEYIRETSTPVGQVGAGLSPTRYYFRANYSLFGPIGVDFMTTTNMTNAEYYLGLSWTL